MTLQVLTPSETLFSGEITSLTAPAVPGILTILPNHTPLTSLLTNGELKIIHQNTETCFSIGEGFLTVTPNEATVLISRGANLEDLDEQIILDAKSRVEEALKTKPTGTDLKLNIALYRQSITDLKLLRKRKAISQ